MPGLVEPSTPTRGHKKKQRTRQQLITAAVDVIAAHGEAFSISDVTQQAGVANGTFYNYFTDRDALIDALVPEVLAAFAAESAVAVANDDRDPALRFGTISALALIRAANSPHTIRLILRLEAVQQAIRDAEVASELHRDLEAGEAAGRFSVTNMDATLDVVIGALLMATRRIVDGQTDSAYREAVVERLLCSLGLEPQDAAAIAVQSVAAAVVLDSQT